MVERRKPLILSSTKTLLDSVLNPLKSLDGDGGEVRSRNPPLDRRESASLQLKAGILRYSNDLIGSDGPDEASFDDASLVGVSASVLKRLSVTSGSLVQFIAFSLRIRFLLDWL